MSSVPSGSSILDRQPPWLHNVIEASTSLAPESRILPERPYGISTPKFGDTLPLNYGMRVEHYTAVRPTECQPVREVSPFQRAKDELISILRSYSRLGFGWDGGSALPAKPGVVDDAISLMMQWPPKLELPEPVLDEDGEIILERYGQDGMSKGSVEVLGEHIAIFSVVSGTKILGTGHFRIDQVPAIVKTLEDIWILED